MISGHLIYFLYVLIKWYKTSLICFPSSPKRPLQPKNSSPTKDQDSPIKIKSRKRACIIESDDDDEEEENAKQDASPTKERIDEQMDVQVEEPEKSVKEVHIFIYEKCRTLA